MRSRSGGSLQTSAALKHILSIGYEFETHDLVKLSLKGNMLINSALNLGTLETDTEGPIDKHSFTCKTRYTSEDDLDNVGETFPEYVYIPTENIDIEFCITNDQGGGDFSTVAKNICNPNDHVDTAEHPRHDKNSLYTFTPKNRRRQYEIKFTKFIYTCHAFSGAEWIVTYYNPKKSNNIILETFSHACNLLFDHLMKLKRIQGTLQLLDKTTECALYNFPGTNLYYMQTTGDMWSTRGSGNFNIGRVTIIPQMTFRVHLTNVMSVCMAILSDQAERCVAAENTRLSKEINYEYAVTERIVSCTHALLKTYRREFAKFAPDFVKYVAGCVFLMLYKINMYVNEYEPIIRKAGAGAAAADLYFKDFLSFNCRCKNNDLYFYLRRLFAHNFGITKPKAAEKIREIFLQPSILEKYIYTRRASKRALTRQIVYTGEVEAASEEQDYGDPSVSLPSYFYFFEHGPPESNDWLVYSKNDTVTSEFDIFPDNTLLIENRLFFTELRKYVQDVAACGATAGAPLRIQKHAIRVKDLFAIQTTLLGKYAVNDIRKKEFNPKTRRWVNRCKPGMVRSATFKCRKAPVPAQK